MMRLGPDRGPVAVLALPLFEEANRTRAFAVAILRGLAARGIGGALPDLPGQGDSLVPLETVTILDMQAAYEGAVAALVAGGSRPYGVAIRSGAILDALALLHGRWHLAPQGGAALVRELTRVKQAEIGHARRLSARWWFDACRPEGAPVAVAGNLLSPDLLLDLEAKEPFSEPGIPRRVVRLASDPAPADRHVNGTPIWRGTEPRGDFILSQALATDIADWMEDCEGR